MESFANVSNLYQVAEIELIYKTNVQASQRPKIESSKDAYNVLIQSWNSDRLEFIEEFKILLLNNASHVLGIFEVSKGGISGASADVRIVFAAALKANATGIILAHNHPSGQLVPSDADKYITENMRKAGELLNIRVLDHLIVTAEGFYSFSDNGHL
ncbi:JAB domain-containing protein [Dyadobacter chenhuakuii]|uniref:JAB domain-containing protein n=1 Tax=Dyadobacter chenhuakuii TaxID=2909339 RepID=A0A9X1TRB2_9BACT|nr:JAB domain-containing protein [Dyadobacter chenhuakuii]MCF2496765.1 JAB domain-containing protein [Dyadobacter chenhuakuii]